MYPLSFLGSGGQRYGRVERKLGVAVANVHPFSLSDRLLPSFLAVHVDDPITEGFQVGHDEGWDSIMGRHCLKDAGPSSPWMYP